MGDVKLTAPRVLVKRDGQDDIEVQADNRDLVAYERTRLRQKPVWPKFDDAPFGWLTFISWSAARRAGLTDLTYSQWEADVLDVASMDTDDTTEQGSPTQPGHDPG
jgi:hypothetical protein